MSVPLLPAATTTSTPLDRAYAIASSNGVTVSRPTFGGVERLRLMTWAPSSAAYRMPATIAPRPSAPEVVLTFTGMIVLWGAIPAMPTVFCAAPTMPATWVPCSVL